MEESIVEKIKLRRQKLNIIAEKKEKISNELFKEYLNYSNPETEMFKRLRHSSDEKNKSLVESINKQLTRLKKNHEKCA